MISRRSFLKISGLAAVALGAGYGAGKVVNQEEGNVKHFSIHGFLPGDDKIISDVVKAFNKKVNPGSAPVIYANKQLANVISNAYRSSAKGDKSLFNNGRVTFRIIKLKEPVDGDILLSDNKTTIYDPSDDFNGSMISLRKRLQNTNAEYMFSAEYSEQNMISSLFNTNEKVAVIENEKGIVDKIKLNNSYKNIEVGGPQGKTGISLANGSVHVHNATCRHELCKHSGFASQKGEVIACAPNKVLIRIDLA